MILQTTILISLSLSSCALLNTELALFLLPTEGYPAEEGEEFDLQSMVTLTLTWFLSQMLEVQEMYTQCTSRVQELSGNQCQEIGAKIGRITRTSMAKVCPLRLPQAMVALLFLTMLLLVLGPLAKLLAEDNSVRTQNLLRKISEFSSILLTKIFNLKYYSKSLALIGGFYSP